jgi:hypothetical protein
MWQITEKCRLTWEDWIVEPVWNGQKVDRVEAPTQGRARHQPARAAVPR